MSTGAFIYCRKSSIDKDRQVLSLSDQEVVCRELAVDKGLTVMGIYKESKSGKRPDKRPEFSAMVKKVAKGEAKHIICWKADRLCRNAKEGGYLIDQVDYAGMKIVTPSMDYDRNNSTFLFIEFGMATKFSKDLSDNVKRAMDGRAKDGFALQKAYLGYRNTPEKLKGEKTIEVDQTRWDLMRQWFDLLLTGKYNVMESLEVMTGKGLRTKKGEIISKTTAYRTLGNIFYTGRFVRNGETYDGRHKRMITDEEYLKIKTIVKGTPHKEKAIVDPLPFKGIMKCGECGTTVTGDKKTKLIKSTGKYKQFAYYRCNQQTTIKGKKTCTQPYLDAEKLNTQVRAYLDRLEIHPDFIKLVRDVMKRRNVTEFELEKKQKEIQTKKLDQILDQKKRIFDMKIDGILSEEDYKKERADLLQEELEIKSYINRDGTAHWETVMNQTLDFAQTIRERFESGDINQKILVLKTLSSNLILKDKQLDLSPKFAFLFLKEAENSLKAENGSVEPNYDLEKGALEAKKPFGAGNGNRTRICYLASSRSTTELYPQY